METGTTLAEALTQRGLRPDAVIRATRYYLAGRLHDAAPSDLRDDLAERVTDGAGLPGTVAASPRLLLETALGVLSAAWEQPGERPRILRALDEHGGKLPAGDMLPVAATLVYGLFLLARAGVVTDESTSMNPDGTYEHRKVERRGALAILLAAFEREPDVPDPGTRPDLPGEGNFTVVLCDIHKSGEMVQAAQDRAPVDVRDVLSSSLSDLSVRRFVGMEPFDRGDGWLILIPDAAGALTPIVTGLPRLVRKRLGDVPIPGLRMRMGIHCGRLRFVESWTGAPLRHVARIIDDDGVKARIGGKRLLTVLSDRVYEETVVAGYAEPAYDSTMVAVKETTAKVWLMAS